MAVKLGIIGPGGIANAFANGVKLCENIEIIAAASRDKKRAVDFCQKHSIKNAYGSYEEMLDNPEIDGVYISTVHINHYELTKLCLLKGKSVICEKPFVLEPSHVKELSLLAKEKNLSLMEAMWTRFLPGIIKAKEWVKDGKIGEVKYMEFSFGFNAQFDPNARLFNKDLAGGALYDVGTYVIETALLFADSPVKNSTLLKTTGASGVDEVTIIGLEFESGALANLSCAISCKTRQEAYVYGTDGYIKLPRFWSCTEPVLYDENDVITEEFKANYENAYDGFKFEIEHFAHLIENRITESELITFEENISCTEIYEKLGL